MDKMFSSDTADQRVFLASIAGVYSPLVLILFAAAVLF